MLLNGGKSWNFFPQCITLVFMGIFFRLFPWNNRRAKPPKKGESLRQNAYSSVWACPVFKGCVKAANFRSEDWKSNIEKQKLLSSHLCLDVNTNDSHYFIAASKIKCKPTKVGKNYTNFESSRGLWFCCPGCHETKVEQFSGFFWKPSAFLWLGFIFFFFFFFQERSTKSIYFLK